MSPSKDNPDAVSAPKIAIKGFSLSSKVFSKSKPPLPSSSLGKRPRSTFVHNEDSDSDDEHSGRHATHELVTGFGEGGAIKDIERKRSEPLVIPKLGNRDWRGEARSKRGKNLLPPEVQAAREAASKESNGVSKQEGVDVVNSNDAEITWGLTVRKKEETAYEELGPSSSNAISHNGDADLGTGQAKEDDIVEEKSADQEALEALLGTRKEKKGPDLVIPAATDDGEHGQTMSEKDAYRRAIAAAPDVSTLEDYERIPVEEFGAAMLRGMGWKGEKQGQVKEVKRRQNLLGLGAKELKDAEELGAWVQKSDVKRLNERGRGGSSYGGDRRPKASDYRREKERRDERREERGGGSYRRDKERDRDSGRDRDRHRESHDYRRR